MKDRKDFYKKLRAQLDETTKFPSDYLYKFIVTSADDKTKQVEEIFDNKGVVINTKKSKTGKYISISVFVNLASSDEVVSYYQQAEKVEGIISL